MSKHLKNLFYRLILGDEGTRALESCRQLRKDIPWANFWCQASMLEREFFSPLLPYSKSQHAQDLFAACHALSRGVLSGGFFVEFGATDGVSLSNSWLLENKLNWSGILAEPARIWHKHLESNRQCAIDYRCVTDQSGLYLDFLETSKGKSGRPELSTMHAFANSDNRGRRRKNTAVSYKVETVSLRDLLNQHNAPSIIDYISIDTEGSELLALAHFDFSIYRFRTITVEHNYDNVKRQKIYNLLSENGYKRVHTDISMCDDWYIGIS